MLPTQGRRFATDEADLRSAHLEIKLAPCPHCGRSGTLIGHGWLRGYAEHGQERVVRGRRWFCSNRYRRPGCGRTFSALLMGMLAGFVVRASTLFRFADTVTAGLARKAAWESTAAGAFSGSSGYRLWQRLRHAQSALRSRLSRESLPPACQHDEPLAGLLAHFRAVFPGAPCPFSAFQARLGQGLFG